MDYEKLKQDATRRRQELAARQEKIQKEKALLSEESQRIQRELAGLDELLESIEFMTSPDIPPDLEPLGFSDQIRAIYQGATEPLTPVEVRDLLLQKGVTGSSSRNLLISVHTVITREQERGNLETVSKGGKTAYTWKGPRRFPRYRLRKRQAFVGTGLYGAPNSLANTILEKA
jgi:hypothetical protein